MGASREGPTEGRSSREREERTRGAALKGGGSRTAPLSSRPADALW